MAGSTYLTEQEAEALCARGHGNNPVIQSGRTYGRILRDNVFTFFNLVLFGLGALLLILGSPRDAFFTVIVAFINILVTTYQEARAKRHLDRIALLARSKARVVRNGRERAIDPREVVLGDLLLAGPGDQVVADGVVVGEGPVDLDESLLTGEANSVTRAAGDRVLSGSFVIAGALAYRAVRVGADSYANQLTAAARAGRHQLTPFQEEINWLIRLLLLLVALYELLVILALWVREGSTFLQVAEQAAVIVGLSPTGLFMMLVAAYALGAFRITGRGALVQRINSVESLSNVTVLCLDKTGTLTSGRLTFEGLHPLPRSSPDPGVPGFDEAGLRDALGAFARSGSAKDATTDALARGCGGERLPCVEEARFSSDRMWSALAFDRETLQGTFVLGAPEALRRAVPSTIELPSTGEYTARGLRTLLFAHRPGVAPLHDEQGQPRLPAALAPLCYVTLGDELRPEARPALEGFRQAGITVKIVSGDDPETVAALARQAGLWGGSQALKTISGVELEGLDDAGFAQAALEHAVFGRIPPEQKRRLVRSLREQGQYVAMAGDGVNDILALKQAQVSIAMQGGSQAAREVADMVLMDDSFAALPHAFREGQRILSGMQDILKLVLVHVFALAFLIPTIAMLVGGFPYSPSQNGFLTILSITIPTLGLTIWARPGPVPLGRQLWRVRRFVMPAALTTGFAGLAIYLFAFHATRDYAYAQTVLTYGKTLLGLLLIPFLAPPTRFWAAGNPYSGDWRPTLLALVTGVLLVAIAELPSLRGVFGLAVPARPADQAFILAVAVFWVLITRWLWRTRLLERYLGVNWDASPGP